MIIPDNLRPICDKVLVRTDPRPKSSGGIVLANSNKEKMRTATVLSTPRPHYQWRKEWRRWIRVEPDPAIKPGARVILTKLSIKAEDYSDDGMRMVVDYDDIGAVEEIDG